METVKKCIDDPLTYPWEKLKREVPVWFRDAKFGLFFHWGPYSVPACENEWYSRNMYAKGQKQHKHHVETYGKLSDFGYKDFYDMLTSEGFDADEWADLVVRSGAKYAGPVTEHSDNFSMWDSKINPNNAVNYGIRQDVVKSCFEAFEARGIKTLATFHHQWLWGWFMSTDPNADVYEPENERYYWKALPLETNRYKPNLLPDDDFNQMWVDRVKEVVDQYKPDMVYFDSRSFIIDEAYRYDVVRHYYESKPGKEAVISYKQEDFPSDIGIYDIECGRFSDAKPYPWQTDDRLEDNITWCIVQNPKYKSALTIVRQLCDVVSKNGNLLLNIGPKADGSFHEDAKKELYAIGDWLSIYGEGIYGTRPYSTASEGPTITMDEDYDLDKLNKQLDDGIAVDIRHQKFSPQDFRFTRKEEAVYIIGMAWPSDYVADVKTFSKRHCSWQIHSVKMVGSNQTLVFDQTAMGLKVHLPIGVADEGMPYILKVE